VLLKLPRFEFGIVAPVGRRGVEELLNVIANEMQIPEIARACLSVISVKPCICNGTKHIRGPDQCVISSQPVSDGRHGSSLKGRLTCQCLGNRVSLRAGEAGDSKSLRDPPQAPCFSQAGAFLFRFGPKRVPFLEISPKSWGKMARQRKPRTYAGASR